MTTSTLTPADEAAIEKTLTTLQTAFARRDADMLDPVYTDDTDWVNAFGSVKKGRVEIVEYPRGLFADANFDAGRLVAPPDVNLRVLTDDVVVASVHLRVAGQGLVGGGRWTATTSPCTSCSAARTARGRSSRRCSTTPTPSRAT